MEKTWKPDQAIIHRYERYVENKKNFKKKGDNLKKICDSPTSSVSHSSMKELPKVNTTGRRISVMPSLQSLSSLTSNVFRRRTQDSATNISKLNMSNKIAAYKKKLSKKKVVKVVKKRYKVLWFIQFWSLFIFLLVINVFACILVVIEDLDQKNESTWSMIELIFMFYFMVELLISFIIQKPPRSRLWFKISTYIDILVIIPRFVRLVFNINHSKALGFLRILRMFKVFRIVRLLKYLKNIDSNPDTDEISYKVATFSPLTKQILILGVSLFSTLFIGAGVVIFIDDESTNAFSIELNYIDAIYYMAVTGSTLGYGDIHPTATVSRFAVVILIVVIIYIFGVQVTKIVILMRSWDVYDTRFNLADHDVIFVFDDNIEILSSFLLYYFRYEKQQVQNHFFQKKRRVLIISNRKRGIDDEMKAFLQLNMFESRIKYLPSKGCVDRRLIYTACLPKANCIYFLCNPASEEGKNQDKMAIIYSHFLKNHNVHAEIFIQTVFEHSDFRNWEELESKTRIHSIKSTLESSIVSNVSLNTEYISNVIQIVCTQKLIMQAMARNLFHNGFIQFLSTMLVDELESSNQKTF